tara:strand:- start:97 stop:576 length:480 start_codon:yes stop_codon:yes gene_type:complete
MITDADCNIVVALSPIGYNDVWPKCRTSFNGIVQDFVLNESKQIEFNTTINKDTDLIIELYGKQNKDSIMNRDVRINIDSLSIMGIENKKFIYQGVYCPQYPEPWASQQRAQGKELEQEIPYTDSLGWNGEWRLTVANPPFSWIQTVLDLGWIYPNDHL